MKELTLKIDFAQYFNDDLENYLLTLDGVKQSKIDKENEEIYI